VLLDCPECGKQVSDRASACPGCGFPIAEHLTLEREAKALELDRSSRVEVGEADCPHCEARGFSTKTVIKEDGRTGEQFGWCTHCEHSGRVVLVQSSRGYWAVAYARVAAFVAGETDGDAAIVFLGAELPASHRYPVAGARYREPED
jgi:hypothetical protein